VSIKGWSDELKPYQPANNSDAEAICGVASRAEHTMIERYFAFMLLGEMDRVMRCFLEDAVRLVGIFQVVNNDFSEFNVFLDG